MFARPPLAQAASAMVQAPTRWLDALRGEPAQEVRGHRQPRLRVRRCRSAVECVARRGAVLDRTGREDLPGRQSPHQTIPVLGMADPRDPASSSRRDLPCRSVHPAETDEGARQARLHAVLHLFYLADAKVGAGAISHRTDALPGARFLSPELLRQYA